MRVKFGEAETQAEARSRYLKETMRVRKVTTEKLSNMTGISKRTLDNYVSGITDPALGKGLNIAMICHVLSMSPYTLGGVNEIMPGASFKTDGKRAVYEWRSYPGQDQGLSRKNFEYAMEYNKMDVEKLSQKSGVPPRVIKEILSEKRDPRTMRAQTIFTLCRAMVIHPAFLYGLRSMREYETYRKHYDRSQEENAFRSEVRDEVERLIKQRRAETDA